MELLNDLFPSPAKVQIREFSFSLEVINNLDGIFVNNDGYCLIMCYSTNAQLPRDDFFLITLKSQPISKLITGSTPVRLWTHSTTSW